MAHTTSAAAAMLLSGSTTTTGKEVPHLPQISHNPNTFLSNSFSYPSIITTMATLSASAPFPTVTLDLTDQTHGNHPNMIPCLRSPASATSFPLPLHGCPNLLLGHPMRFTSNPNGNNNNNVPIGIASLQQYLGQRQSSTMETVSSVIASDPNFPAALAAAISTIIGTPRSGPSGGGGGGGLPGSPQLPQSCTTFSTN